MWYGIVTIIKCCLLFPIDVDWWLLCSIVHWWHYWLIVVVTILLFGILLWCGNCDIHCFSEIDCIIIIVVFLDEVTYWPLIVLADCCDQPDCGLLQCVVTHRPQWPCVWWWYSMAVGNDWPGIVDVIPAHCSFLLYSIIIVLWWLLTILMPITVCVSIHSIMMMMTLL